MQVQTVRVATDPFESWLTWSTEDELIAKGSELQRTCEVRRASRLIGLIQSLKYEDADLYLSCVHSFIAGSAACADRMPYVRRHVVIC